jgi:UDP-glucose 4-epimerase
LSKFLVTGGCGFIGSHLVELLIKKNEKVVVLDNLSTGRMSNLDKVYRNENLKVIIGDIQDLEIVKESVVDCEYIIHLAALADIVPSIEEPLKYFSNNVIGTLNLIEAAKNENIKKFIYAASSSCYGIPEIYPTPEISKISPEYPYALTKWIGEQTIFHWGKIYDLPVISLRLFNVFGPRSRTSGTYGAVFGVFLAQKLAGKPLTIVGDGTQTRDFTFVTDVVDAFWKAALSNVRDEIFNVGSKNSYSINYLAKLLGGIAVNIPKRPGEPDSTHADTSKIEKILNWKPSVTFEEGVQIMLQNIDYWKDAPVWDPNSIKEATKEWFNLLDKGKQSKLK